MDNPAAVLIKFIETKHRPFPKAYKDSKARESRQREQEEQVTRQQAEDFYFDFYSESFRAFQRIEFQAIRENNLEAFTVFEKWLDKNHGRGLRMLDGEATREKIAIGTNNVPCVVYQSMSGLFGKYYGTAGALSVKDTAEVDYNAIIVSPNPVKNTFSIASLYPFDEITLYDMTGKKIYYQDGNNTTISVESLKTGMYLVRVKTSKGLFTCKINKE